jgi:hypothetical protein
MAGDRQTTTVEILRALSTSAPAVSFREDPSVCRRGTCDRRRICTKPLARRTRGSYGIYARPQVRDILIAKKIRRWCLVAKYSLLDPSCPAWRARKNYARFCARSVQDESSFLREAQQCYDAALPVARQIVTISTAASSWFGECCSRWPPDRAYFGNKLTRRAQMWAQQVRAILPILLSPHLAAFVGDHESNDQPTRVSKLYRFHSPPRY